MHRTWTPLAGAAFLLASLWVPASLAQDGDEALRREIEALKQGQQDIRKQLDEIKKLLQQRPTRPAPSGPDVKDKVIDLGQNAVQGAAAAKLTLVELTDYQ